MGSGVEEGFLRVIGGVGGGKEGRRWWGQEGSKERSAFGISCEEVVGGRLVTGAFVVVGGNAFRTFEPCCDSMELIWWETITLRTAPNSSTSVRMLSGSESCLAVLLLPFSISVSPHQLA